MKERYGKSVYTKGNRMPTWRVAKRHSIWLWTSWYLNFQWFRVTNVIPGKRDAFHRRTSSFCFSCTKWSQILRPALLWTMKIAKFRLGTRIRSDPRHQETQGVLGLFPTRPCMTDVVYLRATVLAINKHWEPSNPMASKLNTFSTLTRLARCRCYGYEKLYRPDWFVCLILQCRPHTLDLKDEHGFDFEENPELDRLMSNEFGGTKSIQ